MAHDVPLGGVDQVDLEVAVAELVHEVLELHELVPGAADAHQEDGVVALLVHAVGQGGHPLAGLVDVPAVLEVALLVEVHDLDLLGLLHVCPPITCARFYTSRFLPIPIIAIRLLVI